MTYWWIFGVKTQVLLPYTPIQHTFFLVVSLCALHDNGWLKLSALLRNFNITRIIILSSKQFGSVCYFIWLAEVTLLSLETLYTFGWDRPFSLLFQSPLGIIYWDHLPIKQQMLLCRHTRHSWCSGTGKLPSKTLYAKNCWDAFCRTYFVWNNTNAARLAWLITPISLACQPEA